jgi:hypothetical protein
MKKNQCMITVVFICFSSTRRSRSTSSWSSQCTIKSSRNSRLDSSNSSRSRSTSIPRRHGSPSFLDRRRITRLDKISCYLLNRNLIIL